MAWKSCHTKFCDCWSAHRNKRINCCECLSYLWPKDIQFMLCFRQFPQNNIYDYDMRPNQRCNSAERTQTITENNNKFAKHSNRYYPGIRYYARQQGVTVVFRVCAHTLLPR